MARLYITETADGEWKIIRSSALKEKLRLVPRVIPPGVITIGKSKYVIDSSRFRRIPWKPKRFLKLWTEYHQVQLWREGYPEPIDMFGAPKRDDDITGNVMSIIAKQHRIHELTTPPTDWRDIVLVIMALVLIAMAGAIYSLSSGGHV